MGNSIMNLPINIPWKLIASSPDMMDLKFCDKEYPNPWNSSIAISVYEPDTNDLPPELCGDKISYIKVNCSITGLQPTKSEIEDVKPLFNSKKLIFEKLINQYLACYGVLVNISVFPFEKNYEDNISSSSIEFKQFDPRKEFDKSLEISDVTFETETQKNEVKIIEPATGPFINKFTRFSRDW